VVIMTDQVRTKTDLRWWALAVVSLCRLIVMLDMTIVNIALPWTQQELHLSDSDRQWVVTAYTLAFGGLLVLGGLLGDRIGHRLAVVVGTIGFAVASGVGGAAATPWVLIVARAAQGSFAALLAPATMAFIPLMFSDTKERAKAYGLFSATINAGGALGLLAGGVLCDWLNWRWCMYVNVPLAVTAAIGALALLPADAKRDGIRFDLLGTVLSCGGMVALTYAIARAGRLGWGTTSVLLPGLAALVMLGSFVIWQLRAANPLVPPALIADRNRIGALITIALMMFALFGSFLFETYQLQVIMRYSPLLAGLGILPAAVAVVVGASQISSRLVPLVPLRWVIVPGMLLAALGTLILAQMTVHSSFVSCLLPAEILLGIGVGCVMTPSVSAAMHGASPHQIGVLSGIVSTAQQIGGSLGTVLLNAMAASATAAYLRAHSDTAGQQDLLSAVASVHGYRVASAWGVGVLVVGALVAGLLVTVDFRAGVAARR
jgi:EmrB/QacA subfamily drug resistance transporter